MDTMSGEPTSTRETGRRQPCRAGECRAGECRVGECRVGEWRVGETGRSRIDGGVWDPLTAWNSETASGSRIASAVGVGLLTFRGSLLGVCGLSSVFRMFPGGLSPEKSLGPTGLL